MNFQDRAHAGQELAKALSAYNGKEDTLLLALPRGGVPVAFEIAKKLNLPLDVLLVRKLGVPWQKELAMGAIAEGDICYINQDIVTQLDIPQELIDNVVTRETEELNRRHQLYRGDRAIPQLEGKTVILVDDGLATGATMHAAVNALQLAKLKRLIVAVPVGASDTCQSLEAIADEVICLSSPFPFYAIGYWYKDFSQTSDKDVAKLLMLAATKKDPKRNYTH